MRRRRLVACDDTGASPIGDHPDTPLDSGADTGGGRPEDAAGDAEEEAGDAATDGETEGGEDAGSDASDAADAEDGRSRTREQRPSRIKGSNRSLSRSRNIA